MPTDYSRDHLQGPVLALDLGGTNFRVMYLRVADGKVVEQDFQVRVFS